MASTTIFGRPRVALIGVSGYGRVYYNLLMELHSLGEIQLAAAAVIDPEGERATVAELGAIGCEIFGDYRAMLEKHSGRLELCAIPTGIPWHTPMTLAALKAGAHVLVEKPLAASLGEVEEIMAAERASGRLVMLGFQYHYSPENLDLKRALLASEIGTVHRIRVIGLWPRGAEYYTRTDWAGRIKSGDSWVLDSPISNAFAHHLSLALFFAGPTHRDSAAPESVSAELYRAQPIENFDTAALRIRTDTGVSIHFYASHSCTANLDPEIVIEGHAGRIVWSHNKGYSVETRGASTRKVALGDEQSARLRMFRSAIARLQGKDVFVCGTAIAREHTRCIQAAQRTGPIRDVPSAWVKGNGEAGPRRQTWIVGIEETLRQAFEQARSLREVGCAWAASTMEVAVAEADRCATPKTTSQT
ncbi:MAG TPA: Gfo/Idh/MocA family oxidoreductase [Opitutaceae bacterium]